MRYRDKGCVRRSREITVCVAAVLIGVAAAGPASRLANAAPMTAGTWQARQLPVPAEAQSTNAEFVGPISCPAAGGCVVLGQYITAGGADEDSVLAEKSGGWTATRAFLPVGARQATNLGPYGLVCADVGNCVGTSVYARATSLAAEILREVKGVWSSITLPLPSNANTMWPSIASVACGVAGGCMIVGKYTTTSDLSEGLIVWEQAGVFTAVEAPTPGAPNDGAGLTSVACFTTTECVAVGYYDTSSGDREGLIVGDHGGTVASIAAPLPANAGPNPVAILDSVSCGSSTGCDALGQYETSTASHLGVIDSRGMGPWGASAMPVPTGSSLANPSPVIYAMSCKGTTSCLGVGRYTDSSSATQGLVLVEQSSHWSASIMPDTSGTTPVVQAVSCSSATSCAAAGHHLVSGKTIGYIMTLSGTVLSGGNAPAPGNASSDPGELLSSISCVAADICTVTGTYAAASNPTVRLPVVISQ